VTRLADHAPEPTTKCPIDGEAAQRCLASRPVNAPPSAPPSAPTPLHCWHRLQSSAVNMSTNRVDGWAQCGPFDIAQEACLAHLRRNTAAAAAAAAAAATGLLHATTAAAPLDPLLWPLHHFLDFAGVLLEQLWLMLQAVGIILFSSTGLYSVFVMVFQVRPRTTGARRSRWVALTPSDKVKAAVVWAAPGTHHAHLLSVALLGSMPESHGNGGLTVVKYVVTLTRVPRSHAGAHGGPSRSGRHVYMAALSLAAGASAGRSLYSRRGLYFCNTHGQCLCAHASTLPSKCVRLRSS